MLAAGGCAEMPMFNESCIVRHMDIRKPHESRGRKWLRTECKIFALPGSTSGDTLARSSVGANLVQTMDPR
jgi:hypothetical protein